jgi:hypothetical protein
LRRLLADWYRCQSSKLDLACFILK